MIKKKYKGIVVLGTILSILLFVIIGAVVAMKSTTYFDLAKRARALSDTETLSGLISQYEMEVGKYPENLSKLVEKEAQYGPWLKNLPKDPWTGNDYKYSYNDDGFVIYSIGKDKQISSSLNSIGGDDIGFVGR